MKNLLLQSNGRENLLKARLEEMLSGFAQKYANRSFQEEYFLVFQASLAIALLMQAFSATSSYSYFSGLIGIQISNPIGLFLLTGVVLLFMEWVKFRMWDQAFTAYFARMRFPLLPFALGVVFSTCSLLASIEGGAMLATNLSPSAEELGLAAQVGQLEKEVAEIRSQRWIPKSDRAVLTQKEDLLLGFRNDLAAAKSARVRENAAQQSVFRFAFGVFDLFFLLCVWFQHYYRKSCLLEANPQLLRTAFVSAVPMATPVSRGEIGFQTSKLNQPPVHDKQAFHPDSGGETDLLGKGHLSKMAYYFKVRPELCMDLIAQAEGDLQTTNKELSQKHHVNERTVQNVRSLLLQER